MRLSSFSYFINHFFPNKAFVRALESTSGVIYLTTGVPIEKLTKVNAIIRGKVDLPQSLFTEQVCSPDDFSILRCEKYIHLIVVEQINLRLFYPSLH